MLLWTQFLSDIYIYYIFGLDIKYEDIDESMWKSGMALNHGFDREGNPVGMWMGKKEGGREREGGGRRDGEGRKKEGGEGGRKVSRGTEEEGEGRREGEGGREGRGGGREEGGREGVEGEEGILYFILYSCSNSEYSHAQKGCQKSTNVAKVDCVLL